MAAGSIGGSLASGVSLDATIAQSGGATTLRVNNLVLGTYTTVTNSASVIALHKALLLVEHLVLH